MLYSKKHEFVAVRIPKCGSTTLNTYLLDSKLFNYKTDILYTELDPKLYADESGTITLESLSPSQPNIMTKDKEPKANAHITPETFDLHSKTYARVKFTQERRSYFLNNPNARSEDWNLLRTTCPIFRSGTADEIIHRIPLHGCHSTYSHLVNSNIIPEGTECISTVREPIQRWLSLLNFSLHQEQIQKEGINDISLKLLDRIQNDIDNKVYESQCSYVSDSAIIWNIENLHDHASKFIYSKGGRVRARWAARANILYDRAAKLSPEVKTKLRDYYAEDFAAWEKAYSVYN